MTRIGKGESLVVGKRHRKPPNPGEWPLYGRYTGLRPSAPGSLPVMRYKYVGFTSESVFMKCISNGPSPNMRASIGESRRKERRGFVLH